MSATAILPLTVETLTPDPSGLREDRPSQFARLLTIVRKLIDYGKDLAATLQQRAATDLAAVTRPFGTRDIAFILARITRGLLRANALEARVVELAARPEAPPRPPRAPAQRPPRDPQSAAKPTEEANPRLALLPTAEQIADEVRRRPIGAVLADICLDLGIMPSHPLWRELHIAITRHGGSFTNMFRDIMDRVFPISAATRAAASRTAPTEPPQPARETPATGPP